MQASKYIIIEAAVPVLLSKLQLRTFGANSSGARRLRRRADSLGARRSPPSCPRPHTTIPTSTLNDTLLNHISPGNLPFDFPVRPPRRFCLVPPLLSILLSTRRAMSHILLPRQLLL